MSERLSVQLQHDIIQFCCTIVQNGPFVKYQDECFIWNPIVGSTSVQCFAQMLLNKLYEAESYVLSLRIEWVSRSYRTKWGIVCDDKHEDCKYYINSCQRSKLIRQHQKHNDTCKNTYETDEPFDMLKNAMTKKRKRE